MLKYTGSKCIICEKKFSDDDDIVVCPECGTPYHRTCYNEKGQCVNLTLHKEGKSWKAESHTEKRICVRCRAENPDGALYCCKCGLPFNSSQKYGENTGGYFRGNITGAPLGDDNRQNNNTGNYNNNCNNNYSNNNYNNYNNSDNFFGGFSNYENRGSGFYSYKINFSDPLCGFNPSEQYDENVNLAELGAYVDKNTLYYLPKFKFMKETGRSSSMNFSALLFPQFYFAYRKMPGMAILSMIVIFITSIPQFLLQLSQFNINSGILGQITSLFDMRSSAFSALTVLCYMALMTFRIYISIKANKIYFNHCLKEIPKIKSENPENVRLAALHHSGGTSGIALGIFVGLYLIFSMVLSYLAASSIMPI